MGVSRTLSQVAHKVVEDSIDKDYVSGCGGSLSVIYRAEYGYHGLSDKACKDYLQGLPSVCTVPFYNGEILELLEANGITRKTNSGKHSLIEQYWNACGAVLHKMIRHENENKA